MKKLLIFDRCEQTKLLLTPLLTEQGYQCVWVSDPPSALSALWGERFDAVLIDMTDETLGGEAFFASLKVSDPAGSVPVLVFAAQGDKEAEKHWREFGSAGILSKPLNFHDLTWILADLIEDKPSPPLASEGKR